MALFKRKNPPAAPAPVDVPVNAPATMQDRLAAGANRAIDRASGIYHRNPKLVGGLALLAGALVLNRMKRPHA